MIPATTKGGKPMEAERPTINPVEAKPLAAGEEVSRATTPAAVPAVFEAEGKFMMSPYAAAGAATGTLAATAAFSAAKTV